MGNKLLIGMGLAFLLLVLAVGLRFASDGPSVKNIETDNANYDHHDHGVHHLHPKKTGVADAHDHQEHDKSAVTDTDLPRHIDMLSPEMKQAIKEKLLLHGPMEVIRHPDGRIELPSNGRFTQMPVAVEMPDGSIQIKEYSKLPE